MVAGLWQACMIVKRAYWPEFDGNEWTDLTRLESSRTRVVSCGLSLVDIVATT